MAARDPTAAMRVAGAEGVTSADRSRGPRRPAAGD
jgi:hypothetical protein